jgi:hypothetical protein
MWHPECEVPTDLGKPFPLEVEVYGNLIRT